MTRSRKRKNKTLKSAEEPRLHDLKKTFEDIERIRRHTKPLPKGTAIKDLIEEGRR
jgi:hypothetical protein